VKQVYIKYEGIFRLIGSGSKVSLRCLTMTAQDDNFGEYKDKILGFISWVFIPIKG
jgi:hypothetical protein